MIYGCMQFHCPLMVSFFLNVLFYVIFSLPFWQPKKIFRILKVKLNFKRIVAGVYFSYIFSSWQNLKRSPVTEIFLKWRNIFSHKAVVCYFYLTHLDTKQIGSMVHVILYLHSKMIVTLFEHFSNFIKFWHLKPTCFKFTWSANTVTSTLFSHILNNCLVNAFR